MDNITVCSLLSGSFETRCGDLLLFRRHAGASPAQRSAAEAKFRTLNEAYQLLMDGVCIFPELHAALAWLLHSTLAWHTHSPCTACRQPAVQG
jgi:hypothetical protein